MSLSTSQLLVHDLDASTAARTPGRFAVRRERQAFWHAYLS